MRAMSLRHAAAPPPPPPTACLATSAPAARPLRTVLAAGLDVGAPPQQFNRSVSTALTTTYDYFIRKLTYVRNPLLKPVFKTARDFLAELSQEPDKARMQAHRIGELGSYPEGPTQGGLIRFMLQTLSDKTGIALS